MRFLTGKPQIYIANVDEDGLAQDNDYVDETRRIAAESGAEVIKICAQLEAEMAGLSEDFTETTFEPLDDVWEDELRRLFDDGE